MNYIQIKSHRITPVIMSLAGIFVICVGLYILRVRGITSMVFFDTILGAVFFYLAYIEKKTKILITSSEINFLGINGETRRSILYNSDNVIVNKNTIYLIEGELRLNRKKVFSLWWTDTSASKIKSFFESQKKVPT
jgi:hypothetical protein